MNNFRFGPRSEQRLQGVHPDLVKVVRRALELSQVDFSVSEGLRTYARQKELVAAGKSKTMNSRHLSGHAVDLYPVSKSGAEWVREDFAEVVDAMKRASKALGIPMSHGHDWASFPDSPHHELHKLSYPA